MTAPNEIKLIDPIVDTTERLLRIGHQVTATRRLSHGTQLKTSKKLSVIIFDTGAIQFQGVDARVTEDRYYEELHKVERPSIEVKITQRIPTKVKIKHPKKSTNLEYTVRSPISKKEGGGWRNTLKTQATFSELGVAIDWAKTNTTHVIVEALSLWTIWYDVDIADKYDSTLDFKECAARLYSILLQAGAVVGEELKTRNTVPMLVYKRSEVYKISDGVRYGIFQIGITDKGVVVDTEKECLK